MTSEGAPPRPKTAANALRLVRNAALVCAGAAVISVLVGIVVGHPAPGGALATGLAIGSINGAMFLKEFVDKTPWAHLDIAATAYYERDHAGYAVGATAFGLAMTLRWLRDRIEKKRK